MPMKTASMRERTRTANVNITFNSGTYTVWPIPYGKSKVAFSGRGGTGDPAGTGGGNYASGGNAYNYVITYGNSYQVVDQPGTPYTAVDVQGNSYTAYNPGNTTNSYVYTSVYGDVYNYTNGEQSTVPGSTNQNHSCPSPYSNVNSYTEYYCEDYVTSTTNPPQPYTAYNPTYYRTAYNPPNYTTAYNPNYDGTAYNPVIYNPTYPIPANTGANMTVSGVYFPGGYGGAGPVVNTSPVYIPYTASGLAITVPPGGYINIVVSN